LRQQEGGEREEKGHSIAVSGRACVGDQRTAWTRAVGAGAAGAATETTVAKVAGAEMVVAATVAEAVVAGAEMAVVVTVAEAVVAGAEMVVAATVAEAVVAGAEMVLAATVAEAGAAVASADVAVAPAGAADWCVAIGNKTARAEMGTIADLHTMNKARAGRRMNVPPREAKSSTILPRRSKSSNTNCWRWNSRSFRRLTSAETSEKKK